jgi:hypothetical protein
MKISFLFRERPPHNLWEDEMKIGEDERKIGGDEKNYSM